MLITIPLPAVTEDSTDERSSSLRIRENLSDTSLQSSGGMDIADVKLHKLMPTSTVKEMPSSPASVSSSESFSSVSSHTSNYRAIYPPEELDTDDSMDSLIFGNLPPKRRLGSIDQLIEWTRNINCEGVREDLNVTRHIPPSGSECPLLTTMPPKVMNLCESLWNRVEQRMKLQLLCRGVHDCSKIGVYEIASGIGQGAYVTAIILYERNLSKAGILEQRMREIASQEWKDIPPIRVWWVAEEPGLPIAAPMVIKETPAWDPIRFRSGSNRSTSAGSYNPGLSRSVSTTSPHPRTPRRDSGGEARIQNTSPVLKPNFPRRPSSIIVQTPEEISPKSSKNGDLLTDELDAKLRKLIMSNY